MYIHTYIHTIHKYINAFTHTCMYAYMNTYRHTRTQKYILVHAHTRTICKHVCIFQFLLVPLSRRKCWSVRKYYVEETRASGKGSNRDWRKLYSKTLHNLYSLPSTYIIGMIIQKNGTDGSRGTYGREQKCILGFGEETWRKETSWKK
jgi:hypothetical protein